MFSLPVNVQIKKLQFKVYKNVMYVDCVKYWYLYNSLMLGNAKEEISLVLTGWKGKN